MRTRWKLLGLASVAGVAASGAVVARNRRNQEHYDADELRERLRQRLAGAGPESGDGAARTVEEGEGPPA